MSAGLHNIQYHSRNQLALWVSQEAEEIIKEQHQEGRQTKVTNFFFPACRPTSTASDNPEPGDSSDFEGFTSDTEAMDQEQKVFLIL